MRVEGVPPTTAVPPTAPPTMAMVLTFSSEKMVTIDSSITASDLLQKGTCKATWKREFKLPWHEAGSPHHHDD